MLTKSSEITEMAHRKRDVSQVIMCILGRVPVEIPFELASVFVLG